MRSDVGQDTELDGVVAMLEDDEYRRWAVWAHCTGQTHLFFAPLAERPQARVRREAKAARLCAECPVRIECRDHARRHREYGFWGGENEEQRTRAGYTVANAVGLRRRNAG